MEEKKNGSLTLNLTNPFKVEVIVELNNKNQSLVTSKNHFIDSPTHAFRQNEK